MSFLFNFSRYVLVPILTDWLTTEDIISFDGALCNGRLRTKWITVLSNNEVHFRKSLFPQHKYFSVSPSVMTWAVGRSAPKVVPIHMKIACGSLRDYWGPNTYSKVSECIRLVESLTVDNMVDTCSSVLQCITSYCTSLTELNIRYSNDASFALNTVSQSTPFLRKCTLQGCNSLGRYSLLRLFRGAPLLEEFECNADHFGHELYVLISNCRHLHSLVIVPPKDELLVPPARHAQAFFLHSSTPLRIVHFAMKPETERILLHWHCSSLISIPSKYLSPHHAEILNQMVNLTSLQILEWPFCIQLEGLTSLTELEFQSATLESDVLKALFQACLIRKLVYFVKVEIAEEVYPLMCEHLEELHCCHFDNKTLSIVSIGNMHRLSRLKVLVLRVPNGNSDRINFLFQSCPLLEKLTLQINGRLDLDTMEQVAKHCPRLIYLELHSKNTLSMIQIRPILRECTNLRVLNCTLSEYFLSEVARLAVQYKRRLTELRYNRSMRAEARDWIVKQLPNLSWIYDGY